MLYIIEAILYSTAMLLIYGLFLRNKTFYQVSRYYLVLCGVIPVLLPLLRLPMAAQQRMQALATFDISLPEIVVGNMPAGAAVSATGVGAIYIPYLLYIAVAAVMLAWTTWKVYKIRQIIMNGQTESQGDYVVVRATGYGPGSFGKYILFPGQEVNDTILAHEQAHIDLHHTRDLMIVNVLQILLWPNIFLRWIKKELKEVHEFQADAHVNTDRAEYAQLILASVFNTPSLPEMHSFIIHPIKRRIMMLQKNGQASPTKAITLVSVSLILLLSIGVSAQSVHKKASDNATGKNVAHETKEEPPVAHDRNGNLANLPEPGPGKGKANPDGNGIYTLVDKMPIPDPGYPQFLGKNIVYPESARKKGIEGRVIVKFVVDEQGAIKNPEVMKSPDQSLSDEALRVMNIMPAWTPGEHHGQKVRVYFTLPIMFKMDNDGKKEMPKAAKKESAVLLSPNPTPGVFEIKGITGKATDEEVSIIVTDMQGRAVYTKKTVATGGTLNERVQLSSSLANGMYNVQVQSPSIDQVLHALISR